MQKTFHIAYVTDDNYAMPTHISILSLKNNKKDNVHYHVHVIGDEVEKKHKEYLRELDSSDFQIEYIEADKTFYSAMRGKSTRANTYISDSAMLKFNLPTLLSDVDVVLYLDGDTIVCSDISELLETDMEQFLVGGVDCKLPQHDSAENGQYFNSGVMLLNLKEMRKREITKKLIDYKMNENNYYIDQDAFNGVMKNKVLFFSPIYNLFGHDFLTMEFPSFNDRFFEGNFHDEQECLEAVKVLHVTGAMKPWEYYLPFFTDIFKKYFEMSIYKNDSLKLKSPISIYTRTIVERDKYIKQLEWEINFPRKIIQGKSVVLYGAGEMGKVYRKCINDVECNMVLWVDRNWRVIQASDAIFPVEKINDVQFDYVLIAVSSSEIVQEIAHWLVENGIPYRKLLSPEGGNIFFI